MTEKDIKNIHYNNKNEIQFDCYGQRFHYSMDELRKMIVAVWNTQEKLDKANEWVRNYMDEWSVNGQVWHDLNDLLILLEEVE